MYLLDIVSKVAEFLGQNCQVGVVMKQGLVQYRNIETVDQENGFLKNNRKDPDLDSLSDEKEYSVFLLG